MICKKILSIKKNKESLQDDKQVYFLLLTLDVGEYLQKLALQLLKHFSNNVL
jgi:hypothetical protein